MTEIEKQILNQVKSSIAKSVENSLSEYNSPIRPFVKEVLDKKKDEIKFYIEGIFSEVLSSPDFKDEFSKSLKHKISREIISSTDGFLSKVTSELKNDPIFKAKATLAINNILNELKSNNENPS